MLFIYEYFQSIAFHVEVHPNITHFTQCVTFGFYPTRYHELAHNLFRMTAIYIVPLLVKALVDQEPSIARGAVNALWSLHRYHGVDVSAAVPVIAKKLIKETDEEVLPYHLRDRFQRFLDDRWEDLDEMLSGHLDRPTAQLDPIERNILRIGAFELSELIATPWKVIINESVELARQFGAEQSHKYVNGVLEQLAFKVRPHEAFPRKSR